MRLLAVRPTWGRRRRLTRPCLSSAQPEQPPGADELSAKIKATLDEGKDFYVIVQAACNIEQIMDIKIMTNA